VHRSAAQQLMGILALTRERTEFRFCVAAKMVALTRHAFQLEVLLSEPSLMCGFGHHTTRKILKYRESERHTF
jgi:hypothetical protein